MTNWENQSVELNNLGIATAEVPDYVMKHIKNTLKKKTKLRKANEDLAGHLKEEYDLPITQPINEFIVNMAINGHPSFKKLIEKRSNNFNSHDLTLGKFWVNLQSKYEFNPIHSHSGLFSFVLFVKIPYVLEDELKIFSNLSVQPITSMLQFLYTDMAGQIQGYQLHADKSFEGKIVMFPADLRHCVYPFYTSNKKRITSSGNIYYINEKNGVREGNQ